MGYELVRNSRQWRGLSSDAKPNTAPPQGPADSDTLTEIDTGRRFVRSDGRWVRHQQTIEALLEELIDLQRATLAVLLATHHGNEQHLWQSDVEVEEAIR